MIFLLFVREANPDIWHPRWDENKQIQELKLENGEDLEGIPEWSSTIECN